MMAYITISKKNFFHNLDFLTKKLGSKNKQAVVLKDNAYGHGLKEIASLSKEYGIKKAVVKTEKEALEIESFFDEIIVLNPSFSHNRFILVINSLEKLKEAKANQTLHLKVDTGMHRNGITIKEIEEAYKIASKNSLKIKGALTHFRSADELSSELFWQEKEWKKAKEKLKRYFGKNLTFHSANSATILRKNSYEDDFARCGIAIYGYHQMSKSFGEFELKPVLKLFAQRISSRKLKKGSRVGYGGVGVLEKDSIVSTYDIGYGDGFLRNLYPNLVGKISMDMVSVLGNKDKICLIDDAKEIAKQNNTISYDILVKLSKDIKRVII
jgi:alanine racemase